MGYSIFVDLQRPELMLKGLPYSYNYNVVALHPHHQGFD